MMSNQDSKNELKDLETALFNQFKLDHSRSSPVFILGAPRTGSTVLYQIMINAFKMCYISNLTNRYFFETPILGMALANGQMFDVPLVSSYGKTDGLWGPSEGSAVMKNWFGGSSPSQINSKDFLNGKRLHFENTILSCQGMFGAPVLIKNAWNCFRIRALADVFSDAKFVWIRRDICAAAKSDYDARYATKGNYNSWNSATPANINNLQKLDPIAQVIENQFEFNKAIEEGLLAFAPEKHISIWYENLCKFPKQEIARLASFLSRDYWSDYNPELFQKQKDSGNESDWSEGLNYCNNNIYRHGRYSYSG